MKGAIVYDLRRLLAVNFSQFKKLVACAREGKIPEVGLGGFHGPLESRFIDFYTENNSMRVRIHPEVIEVINSHVKGEGLGMMIELSID